MSFSDKLYFPLTVLDVVCHEIGHAITRWIGGNMNKGNQSGGINEAYADITGTGVRYLHTGVLYLFTGVL